MSGPGRVVDHVCGVHPCGGVTVCYEDPHGTVAAALRAARAAPEEPNPNLCPNCGADLGAVGPHACFCATALPPAGGARERVLEEALRGLIAAVEARNESDGTEHDMALDAARAALAARPAGEARDDGV